MEIQSGSKHIQKCYTYVEVNIIHRILRRSRYTWLRILKREKKKRRRRERCKLYDFKHVVWEES